MDQVGPIACEMHSSAQFLNSRRPLGVQEAIECPVFGGPVTQGPELCQGVFLYVSSVAAMSHAALRYHMRFPMMALSLSVVSSYTIYCVVKKDLENDCADQ